MRTLLFYDKRRARVHASLQSPDRCSPSGDRTTPMLFSPASQAHSRRYILKLSPAGSSMPVSSVASASVWRRRTAAISRHLYMYVGLVSVLDRTRSPPATSNINIIMRGICESVSTNSNPRRCERILAVVLPSAAKSDLYRD